MSPDQINRLKLLPILTNCAIVETALDSLIPKDTSHIGIEDVRGSIMGIEGSGGRIYFEAISFILPDRYKFEGRSRNPAKDEFNALLNYGYGILYSKVEKACIIAGLDPYVGIIHTDHYNKKSLVFDFDRKLSHMGRRNDNKNLCWKRGKARTLR